MAEMKRRQSTAERKADAVKPVRAGGRNIGQVAKDLARARPLTLVLAFAVAHILSLTLEIAPHTPAASCAAAWGSLARIGTATAAPAEQPTMTPEKVQELVLLGKVWGFVKYHHPRLASGDLSCDRELLRLIPQVQEARDHDDTRRVLSAWLDELGDPAPCSPCATLPDSIQTKPPIAWIRDRGLLGRDLSDRLQKIYENRPADPDDQGHVDLSPGVRNPHFYEGSVDSALVLSDARYRLLALYRFWNIIQYWYPHRDLAKENWDQVMAEFVPRMSGASTSEAYHLALMALLARTHDTHAGVLTFADERPPAGDSRLPVIVRWIENRFVVTGYPEADSSAAGGVRLGDVLLRLDGVTVDSLVARWQQYYAASNPDVLRRNLAAAIPWGPAGPCRVAGLRGGESFEVTLERVPVPGADRNLFPFHDLSGDTFQMLTPDLAYLRLSTLRTAEIEEDLHRAEAAAGLILDLRGYPQAFLPFTLGGHLAYRETEFVCFTRGDLANPGTFTWAPPLAVKPLTPRFRGKIAILVDESTQSLAEYTAMALQTSPGARVFGSTTAGADGNTSSVPFPGGVRGTITGIGIFYPDRRPAQRAGIHVDVEVRPTLAGIRARRDEVLEAAAEGLLGRRVDLEARLMDR